MGSTPYDQLVLALQAGTALAGDRTLGLLKDIQPTASISPIAELLLPPLQDVAFGMGGTESQDELVPIVNQTGAVNLAAVNEEQIRLIYHENQLNACWFWVQVVEHNGTVGNSNVRVALISPKTLNARKVAGVIPANRAVSMSAHPPVLQVTPCLVSAPAGIGPGTTDPGIIVRDIGSGTAGANTKPGGTPGWHGPFFKPSHLIVHVVGFGSQTHVVANFRWVELRQPNRPGV